MRRFVVLVALSMSLAWSRTGLAQSSSDHPQESDRPTSQANESKQQEAPGGIQILSDTQGVDFTPYLQQWYRITQATWKKLMPKEVDPPALKKGQDMIRFKILPNGELMPHSMILEGRSGDVALDRAAWSALTNSRYPPLPTEFHGPYIELRALFLYNMKQH
jgi:hypothetical protein